MRVKFTRAKGTQNLLTCQIIVETLNRQLKDSKQKEKRNEKLLLEKQKEIDTLMGMDPLINKGSRRQKAKEVEQ